MYQEEYYVVYPEGDIQAIDSPLPFNSLVDLNGNPLVFPLRTHRIIAYRVQRTIRKEQKGCTEVLYYLELVPAEELKRYVE
ncbi:MAG: hypothetical protein N2Z76_08620 [Treponemataceae bacterium]|nr:hypothetical protein [Treponemataceae bacterium]